MGSFRFAKYDNSGVGIDDPNATATFAKVGAAVPGDGIVSSRVGSYSTPLATLTLAGSTGVFVLPDVPVIPAGRIQPHTRVWFDFRFRRSTAINPITVNIRLGTAGNATDGAVMTASLAAVVGQDGRFLTSAEFGEATDRFTTGFWQPFNGSGANIGADRTSQVNTLADMIVSADISSGSAGDVLHLISYCVRIEG